MVHQRDLGAGSSEEDIAKLGVHTDYPERARAECEVLIAQLKRMCGEPPPGAQFRIVGRPHPLGTSYTVIIEADREDFEADIYSVACFAETPCPWDRQARIELEKARHLRKSRPSITIGA